MNKDEILNIRKNDLNPIKLAEKLQKELIAIYKAEYIPKHTEQEYRDLIVDYEVSRPKEMHPQCTTNHPEEVYECFSVISQHVYGKTREHCLDLVFDKIKEVNARIQYRKSLPNLKTLVNSNIEFESNKWYYFRIDDMPDDYCEGYTGSTLKRMQVKGIDAVIKEEQDKEAARWKESAKRIMNYYTLKK